MALYQQQQQQQSTFQQQQPSYQQQQHPSYQQQQPFATASSFTPTFPSQATPFAYDPYTAQSQAHMLAMMQAANYPMAAAAPSFQPSPGSGSGPAGFHRAPGGDRALNIRNPDP
jgi:hypothetical protein